MNNMANSAKGWNIALWVAQLALAAAYGLFGSMKATQPLAQLATMMTWIPDMSPWFVRTLGIVEIVGAIGLIVPALTRTLPRLTVATALCVLIHQVIAVGFHISKGEFNMLGLNAALIALAVFIFWGRRSVAVVTPRI